MRVTNTMLTTNFLRDLNANTERMGLYQHQMASQKKITRLSQDPVGVITILKSRAKLRDLDMYRSNIGTSKDWLTQTETATSEINDLLTRMKELTVQAANDTNSNESRQSIAAEVSQLKQHLVAALNSASTNKYLFSGYNVTETPFEIKTLITPTPDPAATPPVVGREYSMLTFNGVPMHDVLDEDGDSLLADFGFTSYTDFSDCEAELAAMKPETLSYKVGFELSMDVSIHGLDFLGTGNSNIFKIFDDIDTMLSRKVYTTMTEWEYGSQDVATNVELNPMLEKIDTAQDRVLAAIADIGGRQNRLDLYESRYSLDAINYEATRSKVEDLDMSEASVNFMMAEAVYKAALSVGSRVIQPTLLDFLR